MSSSKDFKNYVLDQLNDLNYITCKPMMGEFLLYYNGVLFGGIYDNRLLIKITKTNSLHKLPKEIPYTNAKPMFKIKDIDDKAFLYSIIKETYLDLKRPN